MREFYCEDVVRTPEMFRVIEVEMMTGLGSIFTSIGQLDVFDIWASFRRTYSDRVERVGEAVIFIVDSRSNDSPLEVGPPSRL